MIETHSLSKTFGTFQALDGLSLTVNRGEIFGFLGPNGAGKTTTIRMLMGILVPTTGEALIDGLNCQHERVEIMRRVGYLPDNPIFYDYLRGREIIEFAGEMHGLRRGEAKSRAAKLLQQLGIDDASEEFAVNYSTGMKKRLSLCCSLIHEPALLILDEPTNGLDPRGSREIQNLLKEKAAQGTTVFLSTHLLDMADRLCDRVGIVHQGRLTAVGAPGDLKEQLAEGGSLEHVFLELTKNAEELEPATPEQPQ